MSDRAKWWVAIGLVVAAAASGAAYLWVRSDLEAQIAGFALAIDRIGYARGEAIPTTEQLTEEVRGSPPSAASRWSRFEVTRSEGRASTRPGGSRRNGSLATASSACGSSATTSRPA
ncbi:MAG: hypothetical protein R3B82_05465 [Sandaracinaceae bacterium]